jgi:hypothetical protein
LLPALADGEHGAGAIGSLAQLPNLVPRLAIHTHPCDAVARLGSLDAVESLHRALGRDEEAHAGTSHGGLWPEAGHGYLIAERGGDRKAVELDPERCLAELRIVSSAQPRRQLADDRALLADEYLRIGR